MIKSEKLDDSVSQQEREANSLCCSTNQFFIPSDDRTILKNDISTQICPYRDGQVATDDTLIKDKRRVEELERDRQYPTCNTKATEEDTLRNHIVAIGECSLDKPEHICQLCGRQFATSSSLKTHLRFVHNQERNYQCPQCNYKAGWYCRLRDHLMVKHRLVHPGSAATLRRHMPYVYGKERERQYSECNYKAGEGSTLRNHTVVIQGKHVQEKGGKLKKRLFKCPQGDYTTVNRSSFQTHLRTVHGKSLFYQCKYCILKCIRLETMRTHIGSHPEAHQSPYSASYTCNINNFVSGFIVEHPLLFLEYLTSITKETLKLGPLPHSTFEKDRTSFTSEN